MDMDSEMTPIYHITVKRMKGERSFGIVIDGERYDSVTELSVSHIPDPSEPETPMLFRIATFMPFHHP
jgi:hypothetical protein